MAAMNSYRKRWPAFVLSSALMIFGQAACLDQNSILVPSSSPPSDLPGTGVPSPAPSTSNWNAVSEKTACEAVVSNDCVGVYGFTVMNDGSYVIGPAPNGQTLQGTLPSSEFTTINQDATAVSGETLGTNFTCTSSQSIPGVQDMLGVLFLGQASATVVYQQEVLSQGSNCYLGAGSQALQLHSDMHTLLNTHYPVPFPSSASPSPSPSTAPIQIGDWGGAHVQMTVTAEGARFQFECASGQTQGPITVGPAGQFSVDGTYTLQNGPLILGVSQQRQASYAGTVAGNSLALLVTYTDSGGHSHQAQYDLIYGQKGELTQLCAQ
jgi:hypothetical protein